MVQAATAATPQHHPRHRTASLRPHIANAFAGAQHLRAQACGAGGFCPMACAESRTASASQRRVHVASPSPNSQCSNAVISSGRQNPRSVTKRERLFAKWVHT